MSHYYFYCGYIQCTPELQVNTLNGIKLMYDKYGIYYCSSFL
ncbi:hypothetical protein VCR12J2_1030169 [Vibrio coralliirubri]|nr:hypothetical protein VCR12J2_1030169 [Vibrio coralliirubri]